MRFQGKRFLSYLLNHRFIRSAVEQISNDVRAGCFWFRTCSVQHLALFRPIYTVRLCRIQQACVRPTTWLKTYRTIVSALKVWFTRNNSFRWPVVSLFYVTKSYRVNRPFTETCSACCSQSKHQKMLDLLTNQVAKHGNTNRVVERVIFPALAIGFKFYRANPRFHVCHVFPRLPSVTFRHSSWLALYKDRLVHYFGLVPRLNL